MAVTPKHSDAGSKKYDPGQEFSSDQRHRFTEIANQAAERRAQKEAMNKATLPKTHNHEADKNAKPKRRRSDWPRTIIWTFVLGALWLWIMFMTR
ncbi:hypothetical protein [Vibrio sp. SCSIO 43136]|uniref:hypothetical protein n=1 Tax=Vibrio sp. SCSIO 43136 TaxID=2819101 RepID=UPI0020765D4D|nr:hypothetical protein [Vibrio sp. SCSIO 43136]USD66363.1 hypothetical protein J4N39_06010 [Vibrio sp. SCSIO 43136]